MNIKELVLKDMPHNLNTLEKARYIYIKLGMYLNYSTKYHNTTSTISKKMHNEDVDITNLNNNQVICIDWAIIYSKLLTEVGVENEIVNEYHRYVKFNYEGKTWIADATGGDYTDLARIKNGDETLNFGVFRVPDGITFFLHMRDCINNNSLEERLIKEIDEKLGLNKREKDKLLEFKNFIKQLQNGEYSIDGLSFEECSISAKLELFFEKLGAVTTGYYEAKSFVKEYEYGFLSEEELKHVHGIELKRTNSDKEVDIVQCIYVEEDDKYNYYLLTSGLPIYKAEPENIIALQTLGFGIEGEKIPGINFLKKFKRGKVNHKSIKYVLLKKSNNLFIQKYDVKQVKK